MRKIHGGGWILITLGGRDWAYCETNGAFTGVCESGVFECHKLSREGSGRMEDDNRSGRSLPNKPDENVSRTKNLLSTYPRMSIRMIVDDLSIPQAQAYEFVTENLAMRKMYAKLIRVLSDERKANNKAIRQYLLHHVNELEFLNLLPPNFSIPKNKIDARGEASRLDRGG